MLLLIIAVILQFRDLFYYYLDTVIVLTFGSVFAGFVLLISSVTKEKSIQT